MLLPPDKKTVIIIAGPTAVGKTAVAIDTAKHFNTEIISADSRQCYEELNIGVARPSLQELSEVKHHFIASHSINENVNAGTFEKFALDKLSELFLERNVVVVTGGTGLYIKALLEGMDDIPPVPAEIRERIIAQYNEKGLHWLQDQLKEKDPGFYAKGEIKNPQRLMRALEVVESTGTSILEFRKGKKQQRNFDVLKIGLALPKEELHHNIDSRVDKMIAQGLVDEVKSLQPFRHLTALQTVGYTEIFDYLDDKLSLEQAIELMKRNTRQYAKRQMTWFKKDPGIEWLHPIRAMEVIMNYEL